MMGFNCYEVKKFHTNEKMIKKWTFRKKNYGLWYVRDSRNISGMVGIFFFLLMMIVFFYTIEKKNSNGKSDKKVMVPPSLTRSFKYSCTEGSFCAKDTSNSIICKGVHSGVMKDVLEEINKIVAQISDRSDLSLSFVDIQNPLDVIVPGWLTNINVKLHSLTIQETPLYEITANSFEGPPFLNLQELNLESNVNLRLNKESFSGLQNLTSLILGGPKCHIISSQEDTLYQVPLLSILQITGCNMSSEVLRNLTGGNASYKLGSLKILDIQNNTLGKVLGDSFTKVSMLESLYLGLSKLNDGLEATAFRGTSPKQILMKSTELTKLPEGIFDALRKSLTMLDLSDNKWNCTCEFQWFQEMYNSEKSIFTKDPLFCYHDGNYEDLSTFSFCGSTIQPTASTAVTTALPTEGSTGRNPWTTLQPSTYSTSDEISTTASTAVTTALPTEGSTGQNPWTTLQPSTYSTSDEISTTAFTAVTTALPTEGSTGQNPWTTSQPSTYSTSDEISTTYQPSTTSMKPTTTNPDDYDPIQCFPANRSSPVLKDDISINPRVIYLGREDIRFSFRQVGNEPKYKVTMDKTIGNDWILIFINHAGWILCLSELKDTFNVENLDYGQSYIVCILRSSQYMVSPKNCQSLSVPEEWGKQSWISNDHKVPIMIGIPSALIFVVLASLCGMYTYIKRNPYLVYGKENVIVVERENSKKVTVQDQNYEQPRYPPSLISWSDGYITPKLYESVEELPIPCIDQYPSEDFRRCRILPAIRRGHLINEEFDGIFPQPDDIYGAVNGCPSPYYLNDDFSHNTYSSL